MSPKRLRRFDEMYLDFCERVEQEVYATRSQVGCFIVYENNILSFGYNGMPPGFPNDEMEIKNADGTLTTNPLGQHAERNAIDKVSKWGGRGCRGATLYCSFSPCIECAKSIIAAGIARVVFRNFYRLTDGIEALKRAGVKVEHRPKQTDKKIPASKKLVRKLDDHDALFSAFAFIMLIMLFTDTYHVSQAHSWLVVMSAFFLTCALAIHALILRSLIKGGDHAVPARSSDAVTCTCGSHRPEPSSAQGEEPCKRKAA